MCNWVPKLLPKSSQEPPEGNEVTAQKAKMKVSFKTLASGFYSQISGQHTAYTHGHGCLILLFCCCYSTVPQCYYYTTRQAHGHVVGGVPLCLLKPRELFRKLYMAGHTGMWLPLCPSGDWKSSWNLPKAATMPTWNLLGRVYSCMTCRNPPKKLTNTTFSFLFLPIPFPCLSCMKEQIAH